MMMSFPDYVHIYTDASLDSEASSAGFGIFCPQLHQAVEMCLKKDVKKAIIFSD